MLNLIRQLICEKPNCDECSKVKSLEKAIEYWKAQRELSYNLSKEKENQITQLENNKRALEIELGVQENENYILINEILTLEDEIENLKKSKGLYYKSIPDCLKIKDKDNKEFVYLGGTFFKLYTNFDVQFKPFNQHFNFYQGLTSASIMILMRSGLIDNNTGEIKKGFTAEEVFEKIVLAVQNYATYATDQTLFFFADCWTGSTLTTAFKKQDCEDLHILVCDAFNTYEYLTEPFDTHSVFLGLGYFRWGTTSGGHAYPMLIAHDITEENVLDKIRIGEATSRVGSPRTLKRLKASNIYYGTEWGIHGIMNEKNLFGGYTTKEEYRWYNDNQQYK